jgi:hypothetical protein
MVADSPRLSGSSPPGRVASHGGRASSCGPLGRTMHRGPGTQSPRCKSIVDCRPVARDGSVRPRKASPRPRSSGRGSMSMPIPVGNYVMIVDRGDARSLTVVDAHTRGIRNNEARVRALQLANQPASAMPLSARWASRAWPVEGTNRSLKLIGPSALLHSLVARCGTCSGKTTLLHRLAAAGAPGGNRNHLAWLILTPSVG